MPPVIFLLHYLITGVQSGRDALEICLQDHNLIALKSLIPRFYVIFIYQAFTGCKPIIEQVNPGL